MSWHNLIGTLKQYAPNGGNGTVTIGAGECVLLIVAHASSASATLSILGGPAIPIVNGAPPTVIANLHTLMQSTSASSTIVGTNTDQLYVQTVKQGNA
jgi:hypothetical protein